MAAPTQIACEFYLISMLRKFGLTGIVRTLKGIGLLDASPLYSPVPGFERFVLLSTEKKSSELISTDLKEIFAAARIHRVDATLLGHLQNGMLLLYMKI